MTNLRYALRTLFQTPFVTVVAALNVPVKDLMTLKQVAWMTLAGGTVGLAAAVAIGRFGESLLYQLKGYDGAVLSGAAVVLSLVALGAGFLPALRASRVEPMRALRYE